MDLHRELRPWIADVELADSDLRDAAHVLLAGVRLTADLAIHASGFASHGPRGARRSERYLIRIEIAHPRQGLNSARSFERPSIHASGFARHGPRGARRSEGYLILGGGGRV